MIHLPVIEAAKTFIDLLASGATTWVIYKGQGPTLSTHSLTYMVGKIIAFMDRDVQIY